MQGRERTLRGSRRAPARDELAEQSGDVFDSDRRDPTVREPPLEVAFKVIAVLLERTLATLIRLDPLGKPRQPPARDGAETQPR